MHTVKRMQCYAKEPYTTRCQHKHNYLYCYVLYKQLLYILNGNSIEICTYNVINFW